MARSLTPAAIALIGNAVGVLVAAAILDDMTLNGAALHSWTGGITG